MSWADADHTTIRFRCPGCLAHIDFPCSAADEAQPALRDFLYEHRRCERATAGASATGRAVPERTAPVLGLSMR